MEPPHTPDIDDALRARLVARYGRAVESWLDTVSELLADLAQRWELSLGPLIAHGHMSVVVRCGTRTGDAGVLKVCPDRKRLASEANALTRWQTASVVSVVAVDTEVGALLLEAVEPGTMLLENQSFPTAKVATLLRNLHVGAQPEPAMPALRDRVANLFDSWARQRQQRPDLLDVVSPSLFQRSRDRALELAEQSGASVLLHGDLTPVNVLDGGPHRGLVAIDPAPCVGDAAFDAIDLLFSGADSPDIITARADALAAASGVPSDRYLAWCRAFAAMTASEIASESHPADRRIRTALALARDRFPGIGEHDPG